MPNRTSSSQFKGTVQPKVHDDLSASTWREVCPTTGAVVTVPTGPRKCALFFFRCSWFLLSQRIWEEVFVWGTSEGGCEVCRLSARCQSCFVGSSPRNPTTGQWRWRASHHCWTDALTSAPGKTSPIRDSFYCKTEPLCFSDGCVCIHPGCSHDVILRACVFCWI